MRTKQEVIESIGIDRWRQGATAARLAAPMTGYGRKIEEPEGSNIPHEIERLIWDDPGSWRDKISLLFELYDQFPAYAHLMYARGEYQDFPAADRQFFWDELLKRLGDPDDALGEPIAYALWCDWFEHPSSVEEAWGIVTAEGVPVQALKRALIASGPVPFHLKEAVYRRLIKDPSWHYYIFRSLLHSAYDVLGQLDRHRAGEWLDRLQTPADTENLERLKAKLGARP